MTNQPKIKGTAFETEVVRYLNENGYPHAERRALVGTLDKGDITGMGPELVIECKNHKTLDFSGWLREAEAERLNANAEYGIVVAKKRGAGAAGAYVVLTLADFVRLWRERDQ
jgi:Holliday junction resolvase